MNRNELAQKVAEEAGIEKSQATKAVLRWVEALNRPPWKVQLSKCAPAVVTSLRSTFVKVHSTKRVAPRSSPYQSSSRNCRPTASPSGAGPLTAR